MPLGCRRKSTWSQEKHANCIETAPKVRIEPKSLDLWDSNVNHCASLNLLSSWLVESWTVGWTVILWLVERWATTPQTSPLLITTLPLHLLLLEHNPPLLNSLHLFITFSNSPAISAELEARPPDHWPCRNHHMSNSAHYLTAISAPHLSIYASPLHGTRSTLHLTITSLCPIITISSPDLYTTISPVLFAISSLPLHTSPPSLHHTSWHSHQRNVPDLPTISSPLQVHSHLPTKRT